jgi:hypothetical protein
MHNYPTESLSNNFRHAALARETTTIDYARLADLLNPRWSRRVPDYDFPYGDAFTTGTATDAFNTVEYWMVVVCPVLMEPDDATAVPSCAPPPFKALMAPMATTAAPPSTAAKALLRVARFEKSVITEIISRLLENCTERPS